MRREGRASRVRADWLLSDFWGDVSVVDVFEQVEEEIRSDRYKRMAKVWLPVVGGILALALIAALGWWGWQSYQTGRAEKASVAYDRGLEQLEANNPTGANAAFVEAANEGNGAYKNLALQQQAGIALSQNKADEALALLDQAADAVRDPVMSDPAALKAAFLVMDTGTLADVEARLEPLIEEGRPMRPFAMEALALARIQNGQAAQARDLLVQLQLGQDVPDSVRQRAQAAIGAIDNGTVAGIAAIVKAQAALPAQPAPQTPQQAAPQAQAAQPAAPQATAPAAQPQAAQ